MTGLVMNYLENEIGGLENMQKRNAAKAKVEFRQGIAARSADFTRRTGAKITE